MLDSDASQSFDAGSSDGRCTIASEIARNASRFPAKPCLVFHQRQEALSYRGFVDGCLHQAGWLTACGVVPGDIVMIILSSQAEAYTAYFGSIILGAIPTFMPGPSGKQDKARYWSDHAALIERLKPRAILTTTPAAEAIEASGLLSGRDVALLRAEDAVSAVVSPQRDWSALLRPRPTDVALLQHSSGTTGLKKGVMLSHAAVVAQVRSYREALGAGPDDVVASWLPVYHDMGLVTSTIMPLMLGQTIVVLDPFDWAARPASILEAITHHRATLVWQPNFAFEHLVRTVDPATPGFDVSCVKAFVNCSEPCLADTFDRFANAFGAFGVRSDQLQTCYAMAETVFAVSQTPPAALPATITVSQEGLRTEGIARPVIGAEPGIRLLSNGPPIRGMEVQVMLPDGRLAQEDEVGEIVISGESLFDGYFRLPEITAARLTSAGFHTGDRGFLHGGEIYLLGRADDMMIVHGRNYYAGEIEAVVSRVKGVKPGRAVALGVPNNAVGSHDLVVVSEAEPAAAVDGKLPAVIKRAVLQEVGVAVFEVRIVPPGWLSKTSSGKISRHLNLARYIEERGSMT